MNGIEMCKKLKEDVRTSHIPVVILTAKADRNSKLEGLETGADDYIIKPFDSEILQGRVNNLIEQRRKLRERYKKEFLTDPMGLEIAAPEEEFLNRITKCVHRHISDPDFSVEKMSSELSMSRVQLYRKVCALTNQSPLEFIRNTRLKLAASMFHQGHKNVSRVMYEVGFSTPSYFTQQFRNLYGMNPSAYIRHM